MYKRKAFLWSIVVALGGFLFGFDTAVISGAEQAIQKYWLLSPYQHGFTISIALIGTIFGSLFGSIPSDRLGRRSTLFIIAGIYLMASLGTAFTNNWLLFLGFRFIGGLGVGASSVTAPVYISEISPSESRGRMVAMFQFNVVFGILFSFFSNYIIGQLGETSWRLMLGIQAVPSLLFLLLLRLIPESPRWLILNNKNEGSAISTLKIINPYNYREVIENIKRNNREEAEAATTDKLFTRKNKFPIFLAMSFAVFNQVSGINAIIYYAPRIFEMTGLGKSSSLLSTVGIGAVNFLFTLLAINFIDKIGRRTLMLIGSFGLIGTLGLVAKTFFGQNFGGWNITVYLLLYIAFLLSAKVR